MISRLTTFAAAFAVIATVSLAFAASPDRAERAAPAAATPLPIVQLEPVEITATRRAH
jgi:hypothetical protein